MYKKLYYFAFITSLTASLLLPMNLCADAPLKIRVTADQANIRQSASLTAPVIFRAEKGQVFEVAEKSGEWYLIQLPNGTPGYIHQFVVEAVPENESPAIQTPPYVVTPVQKTPSVVTSQISNVADSFSMFLLRAGYFLAADSAYTEVYNNGLIYGGELRIGKKNIAGWLEASYRAETGELTDTKEETKVSILAIEVGAFYRFEAGHLHPYAGVGVGYFMFNEKNDAIGEAKKGSAGFCVLSGASLFFGKNFVLDARLKYSICKMKPADFDIEIGGLTVGIGAGFRF